MARTTAKKPAYVPKATTTTISARVKLTVKIKDNFISVEGNEERSVPNTSDVNVGKEWDVLWEDVYEVCDKELSQIVKEMTRKK